jgi:peptidoglycan/LPS O-acetylase OafA/YrhL
LIAPLAAVGIAVLLVVVPGPRVFSAWILAVGLCSAWLILRTLDGRSLVSRTLSVPPLVFLGRISYALYLWHIPIYLTLGVSTSPELLDAPALALSLACAIASYHFVELPFLRKKRRARSHQIQRGSDSPALTPASS